MQITKEIRTAYFSEFRRINLPKRVVLFTSALAKEGKTFISIELAIGAALKFGNHQKILYIDMNSLNQDASIDLLGHDKVKAAYGLVNILVEDQPLKNCIYQTHVPLLSVIPFGQVSDNFEPLEHLEKLHDLIHSQFKDYLIFIDAGSVFVRNRRNFDPTEIAQIADHVVMVVLSGKTPREIILKCKKDIESCGGKVSGIIMNDLFVKAFRSEISGYLTWLEFIPLVNKAIRYLRARFGIY